LALSSNTQLQLKLQQNETSIRLKCPSQAVLFCATAPTKAVAAVVAAAGAATFVLRVHPHPLYFPLEGGGHSAGNQAVVFSRWITSLHFMWLLLHLLLKQAVAVVVIVVPATIVAYVVVCVVVVVVVVLL